MAFRLSAPKPTAYICTNFVSLYERTGRSVKAVPNAREALTIREIKTKDENDLANGFSDVGYSLIAAYQAEEGLRYLEKALAIAEAVGEPDRYKVFSIDGLWRNHGRGNMLLGRYSEARADFDKAEYYQPKIVGENSQYDGERDIMVLPRINNAKESQGYVRACENCSKAR